MKRRNLALGLLVVLAAVGCSSGGHRATPTTVAPPTTVPSTSTTAPAPDPDVIPSVITPAYVNAVFAVLNHINGDAVRSLLVSRSVTPSVRADLRSIYNDPLYSTELEIAEQSIQESTSNVRNPPGDRITTVRTMISSSATCIFVETQTSLTPVLKKPPAPAASEFYRLVPKQGGADPQHLNPTPWALNFNATYETLTSIPNQCAGS